MCGCHSHGFRAVSPPLPLSWHTEFPFLVSYLTGDITAYTAFTHLWRENAVCAVLIVASCSPCAWSPAVREHAFYTAKVFHVCRTASVFMLKTTEIFLSEHAVNVYFHRFRHKPSDCRAAGVTLCEQRKTSSLTDGAKLLTKGKKIKNNF